MQSNLSRVKSVPRSFTRGKSDKTPSAAGRISWARKTLATVIAMAGFGSVASAYYTPPYSPETGSGTPPTEPLYHCECDCAKMKWTKKQGAAEVNNSSQKPTDSSGNCPSGMARYGFDMFTARLHIEDDPLSYLPAFGPPSGIRFTYQHHTSPIAPAETRCSNMGTAWKLNWVQFIEIDSSTSSQLLVGGQGGTMKYSSSGVAPLGLKMPISAGANGGYERKMPDGSVEVYDIFQQTNTGEPARYYLHKWIDSRVGRQLTRKA